MCEKRWDPALQIDVSVPAALLRGVSINVCVSVYLRAGRVYSGAVWTWWAYVLATLSRRARRAPMCQSPSPEVRVSLFLCVSVQLEPTHPARKLCLYMCMCFEGPLQTGYEFLRAIRTPRKRLGKNSVMTPSCLGHCGTRVSDHASALLSSAPHTNASAHTGPADDKGKGKEAMVTSSSSSAGGGQSSAGGAIRADTHPSISDDEQDSEEGDEDEEGDSEEEESMLPPRAVRWRVRQARSGD